MSRSTLAKVLLIALLFVTVLMTRPADRDWFTVAILIFGIVNVLLDPPGTLAIRAMAIAATFATLLNKDLRAFMLILGWLVWPPAFMVSWALGRESRLEPDAEQVESTAASLRARKTLAVSANTTKVTWTLRYDRGLDPSWYFGPWERYAAGLAADYLIDSVATP